MFRVVSTSPTFGLYVDEPLKYLEEKGCQFESAAERQSDLFNYFQQKNEDVNGLIVGIEKIDKDLIKILHGLGCKIIAKHGAGVDNINLNAASLKEIIVTNAPGANSNAVSEMVLGLIISSARQIPYADKMVKDGIWPRIVGYELKGKVLGLLGTGQVGKKLAEKAVCLEMKVLAHDIYPDLQWAQKTGVSYISSVEELFKQVDFISIHVPKTEKTAGMVNANLLQLMKKTAFLINTSRGGIVVEEDLYEHLKGKKIKGAALDVFATEPINKPTSLLALDNFIATPHMAGYTYEALKETGMICARNIVKVFQGENPDYIVNG